MEFLRRFQLLLAQELAAIEFWKNYFQSREWGANRRQSVFFAVRMMVAK